jgi:hypothetical protein
VLHDPLDRGGQSLGGLVSGISEIVTALGGRNEFEELTGGLPQRLFRASGSLTQQRFELGKELFDRVEIGAIGRQVEQAGAVRDDCLVDAGNLVRGARVDNLGASDCAASCPAVVP